MQNELYYAPGEATRESERIRRELIIKLLTGEGDVTLATLHLALGIEIPFAEWVENDVKGFTEVRQVGSEYFISKERAREFTEYLEGEGVVTPSRYTHFIEIRGFGDCPSTIAYTHREDALNQLSKLVHVFTKKGYSLQRYEGSEGGEVYIDSKSSKNFIMLSVWNG